MEWEPDTIFVPANKAPRVSWTTQDLWDISWALKRKKRLSEEQKRLLLILKGRILRLQVKREQMEEPGFQKTIDLLSKMRECGSIKDFQVITP